MQPKEAAPAPAPKKAEDVAEKMDMSVVADEVEAMEAEVEDIDAEDVRNPQLVTGYVNDIYRYLRHLEVEQGVAADYLGGQAVILPKMRGVLVDWLVGVHLQFHLLQETLFTTVAILDRCVTGPGRADPPPQVPHGRRDQHQQAEAPAGRRGLHAHRRQVKSSDLRITCHTTSFTCCTCLCRYEEIYAPEVKDFVYITDRAYTEKDILKMEVKVLSVLK